MSGDRRRIKLEDFYIVSLPGHKSKDILFWNYIEYHSSKQ